MCVDKDLDTNHNLLILFHRDINMRVYVCILIMFECQKIGIVNLMLYGRPAMAEYKGNRSCPNQILSCEDIKYDNQILVTVFKKELYKFFIYIY